VTRWERLESWLFDNEIERFDVHQLAAGLGEDTHEATWIIQSYLIAQRAKNSSTLFVLKREGRTRRAVWSVGQRTADARVIGGTLFEDVNVKVRNAFAPDLKRLAEKNPRAARYAAAKIEAVTDGAMKVLAAAVDNFGEDDE
jgi:hypothetical protein